MRALGLESGSQLFPVADMGSCSLSIGFWAFADVTQNPDVPTLLGFIIRGFIWDIPVLIFAYVLFWGPINPDVRLFA